MYYILLAVTRCRRQLAASVVNYGLDAALQVREFMIGWFSSTYHPVKNKK